MVFPNVPAFAVDPGCQLNSAKGDIKHVIYLQFDNVHFKRDNPNVSSDLEQMPHLLNFMKDNGVVLTNHHTPLISHTADDIITSETGVYGDRHGQPVANSFGYFASPGVSGIKFPSSFTYWTDPVSSTYDKNYSLLTQDRHNAPAPWVAYTRAGCNFGAVSLANMELENIAGDITTVYGNPSPQSAEATTNPSQAIADFEGIAIHCANGDAICSAANGGRADILPDEPGTYTGFNALFGHKYVASILNSTGPLRDLNGKLINDTAGHIGFPGFGGITAAQTLSYVLAMQEHGVPITYGYISDAHDNHAPGGLAFGPGQAGYEAALASYDDAFNKFFTRLNSDGINSSNTLFIITSDENDHFVGGPPTPANCDGINIACTYTKIGEIDANLATLLKTEQGITTPFAAHSDSAPTIYIHDNPTRTNSTVRAFEQATGKLTAVNPITGNTDTLTVALADPVEMKLLHMVTGDPNRTPTFTMFGDPDYFYSTFGAPVVEAPGFAWNHGDVQPEITTTWLGMVGPGVDGSSRSDDNKDKDSSDNDNHSFGKSNDDDKNKGIDSKTWSDHTDIRPTMMMLLGLKDDYSHDGRALVEDLKDWAIPKSARDDSFTELAKVYKKIDAPVGQLSLDSLKISTKAINSTTPGDADYTNLENKLITFTTQRDTIKDQIINLLEGAEFNGLKINNHTADTLVGQANDLLHQVKVQAGL